MHHPMRRSLARSGADVPLTDQQLSNLLGSMNVVTRTTCRLLWRAWRLANGNHEPIPEPQSDEAQKDRLLHEFDDSVADDAGSIALVGGPAGGT